METQFDYRQVINRLLARPGINVFDGLINELEAYFDRPVFNIQQMKDKENKKKRGDIWENFSRDWLMATGKYVDILPWSQTGRGQGQKQDNGIDFVAQTATGYVAIQAKYRSKGKRIDWRTLSTFIALSERTGPYEKYLVITNCPGVTRKMPRTARDQSICLQTFRNTTRDHWLKIIGIYDPRSLTETEERSEVPTLTLDQLRTKRLERFEK